MLLSQNFSRRHERPLVAALDRAEQCGKLVKALHDDEGLYVIGSTAASGPYPSVPGFKCFFRLSAQVYLERSDFVRLGEAVLKRVAAE